MKVLDEGSYFSDLHKFLVEKSKYLPYGDVITYHPETMFDYTLKEWAACLVPQWFEKYLVSTNIDFADTHRRDNPITFLLRVILEYIASAQVLYVDSVIEDTATSSE